jgi:phytoene synthase
VSTKDYCQNKAAPLGSNFYYSILFYSRLQQQSLYTLHAFATEIGDIVNECSDPGVARIKLQWWHEEIQRVFNEQARHPVGKALTSLIALHSINENKLHQFVFYNEKKLENHQFNTYEDLNAILRQGPGLIWELTAEFCGYRDQKTSAFANNIGCLLTTFEIIQNIHHDALRGHILLPNEVINNASLTLADLINPYNNKIHDFFAAQIQRLIDQMEKNYTEFPAQDRYSQLCCLIMNRLITKTCKEIEKDNFNLHQHKITLTPLRKLWIAWCTQRHAKKTSN